MTPRLFAIVPVRRVTQPGARGGLRDVVHVTAADMTDAMTDFYRQYPDASEIERVDDLGTARWAMEEK